MEDANFWHLGGVTRWKSQFLIHAWTFLAIISVASQLFLCLFWISLWLKNRCLQHPCFKNLCKIAQASKNSDSNAQHFLSDLLTHSWFHSMLFALPSYQFPYIVMNRCLYLRATSHTRLKTLDHGNVKALIGWKGGDGPSSLHTRRWRPKGPQKSSWMKSLHGVLNGGLWIRVNGLPEFVSGPPPRGGFDENSGRPWFFPAR
jgi:hypothetical protein